MAKLKEEFKDFEVGFNGRSGKLSEMKQKHIDEFYHLAKKSKYDDHLDMFEGEGEDDHKSAADAKTADFIKGQAEKKAVGQGVSNDKDNEDLGTDNGK